MSWLEFALNPFPDLFAAPPGGVRVKVKDALLKKRLTDRQIDVAYDYLTRGDHDVMGGMLGFATYGGRVNTVAPDATASAQRNAIFDMACTTGWLDPKEDAVNLEWVRAFYRDVFAETGGVPVPGDACDGALINHPDTDLADPTLNTLRCRVAHDLLPGELPAPAASQSAVGPAERVPPRAVGSRRFGHRGPRVVISCVTLQPGVATMICLGVCVFAALIASIPTTGAAAQALSSPEHARLAAMAGVWDVEVTFWLRPGGPGLASKGVSTIQALFGGLFIEEKIEGTLNGTPFTTLAWTGFNTVTHRTRQRASPAPTRFVSPRPAATTRTRSSSSSRRIIHSPATRGINVRSFSRRRPTR